ncbi:MAG: lysylphosphatidylglycerol synthase transmembrane domain-containing protein [Candidatus Woesearchaeota archaeon]
MNKKLSLLISLLLGLSLIVVIAYYIGFEAIRSVFTFFSFRYLILFLIVSFLIFFLRTLKWYFIAESHDIRVPFYKLFIYRIADFSISFLTPSAHVGGEPIRAYLLSQHNIKFKKAFSSVIIDKSIELTLNGLFTCIFLILVLINFKLPESIKLFSIFLSILIIMLIFLFYYKTLSREGFFSFFYRILKLDKLKFSAKYTDYVRSLDNEVSILFYKSRYYFGVAFLLHMSAWILSVFEYQIILKMLGLKVDILSAFAAYAATGVSYIIPIPAALGVLEFSQSIMSSISGFGSQVGFVLSFIIRGRDGLITLFGIIYLYFRKINFITQLISNNGKAKEPKIRIKNSN